MGNILSSFEQNIKNSLEGVELPYDSESWNELDKQLTKGSKLSNSRNWLFAASFIAFSAVASYLIITNNSPATGIAPKKENVDANIYLAEGVFNKLTVSAEISSYANVDSATNENENTDSSLNNFAETKESLNILEKNNTKTNNSSTSDVDGTNTTNDDNSNSVVDAEAIVPSITVSTNVACAGETIDFAVSSGNIEGNYLWNFGNGDFSDQPVTSTMYNEPGVYKVAMSVTSSKDGQMRRIDISSNIEVLPAPESIFDWEYVNEYATAPKVKFVNISTQAVESYWEFDGKYISSEISPIQEFKSKGDHTAKLVVTNQYGCSDEEIQVISIRNDFNLLADKTFSPNNDGRNDYFIPNSLRVIDNDYKFSVFSNGKLIFESTNESEIKEWNGELLDGSIAKVGAKLQWTVLLIDDNNEEQFYGGVITIVP